MIKQAAIRLSADIIATLPKPNRHKDIIWALHNLGISKLQFIDQGFLDENGEFLQREEAAKIALANGQAKSLHAPPDLHTEDLW
jgi:hypothetical protein